MNENNDSHRSSARPHAAAWRDFALCAETDPDAFFPEMGGSTEAAKRVCRSCEVRAECLTYALERGEGFGIWGGLTTEERRKLRREVKRDHRSPAVLARIAAVRAAGERQCAGPCGAVRPLGEFPRRGGVCKPCLSEAMRERNRLRREAAA